MITNKWTLKLFHGRIAWVHSSHFRVLYLKTLVNKLFPNRSVKNTLIEVANASNKQVEIWFQKLRKQKNDRLLKELTYSKLQDAWIHHQGGHSWDTFEEWYKKNKKDFADVKIELSRSQKASLDIL